MEKIASKTIHNLLKKLLEDKRNVKQGIKDGLTFKEIGKKYNIKFSKPI